MSARGSGASAPPLPPRHRRRPRSTPLFPHEPLHPDRARGRIHGRDALGHALFGRRASRRQARLQPVPRAISRIVAGCLEHVLDVRRIARQRRQAIDQLPAIVRDDPLLCSSIGTASSIRRRGRHRPEPAAAIRFAPARLPIARRWSNPRCAAQKHPAKDRSRQRAPSLAPKDTQAVRGSQDFPAAAQSSRRSLAPASAAKDDWPQTRDRSPPRHPAAPRANRPRWDARIPSRSKSSAATTARCASCSARAVCSRKSNRSKYCPAKTSQSPIRNAWRKCRGSASSVLR